MKIADKRSNQECIFILLSFLSVLPITIGSVQKKIMINIQQATEIVLDKAKPFPTEQIPLEQATGRILKENLKADRDLPPYNRVTMDGIAIQYAAYAKGQRSFPIEKTQPAGSPQSTLDNPNSCIEIMTGAVLPNNTDTIIRYEDFEVKDKIATIQIDTVQDGQNVHNKGEDRKANTVVVPVNTQLVAPEIGLAAATGKTHLIVAQLPKVVIVSTGDELVKVSDTPKPYQVRQSNSYMLTALLSKYKVQASQLHILDDAEGTYNALAKCIEEYDVIVLSGGVSKGKFDYVPVALERLGVQKFFHRVKQRPGKPFWFGQKEDTTIFALPGNPVSAFMCANRYLVPWMRKGFGLDPLDYQYAILDANFEFKPDLQYFLQVKLTSNPQGQLIATPYVGRGSGDFANLVRADAFMELPQQKSEFKKGEVYPILKFR